MYFQPPSSVHIKYPAIIYSRANIENLHANNRVYLSNIAYQLTVVDRDPDSEIVDKVSQLPKCSFNRHYVADNLHHDVFTIYF